MILPIVRMGHPVLQKLAKEVKLDGIIYPQRMTNLQKFGFVADIKDSLVRA